MDDQTLIETLLYKGEGSALDYKVQQYPHDGAIPEAKGELLKDILAFSNAWREETAYILIGVSNAGEVVGLDKDLDDSRVQEFINGKTNAPVNFSYRSLTYDGKTLGLYTIPVQDRPIFAKKLYGKVAADTVYVRRGSATAIARPDEIAKMGAMGSGATVDAPAFAVKIISPSYEQAMSNISLEYKKFNLADRYSLRHGSYGPLKLNQHYYRELARYIQIKNGLVPFTLEIKNTGTNFANDLKLYLSAPCAPDFCFLEDFNIPLRPSENNLQPAPRNILARHSTKVKIYTDSGREVVAYTIGKIQAGETVRTQTCCLVLPPTKLENLKIKLLSDQLRVPVELSIGVGITATEEYLTQEMIQDANWVKKHT